MRTRPASTLEKLSQVEVILYHVEEIWSQRWDSNPRPADYESAALPLSYAGTGLLISPRLVAVNYLHLAQIEGENGQCCRR